jgi:hypothetical protein
MSKTCVADTRQLLARLKSSAAHDMKFSEHRPMNTPSIARLLIVDDEAPLVAALSRTLESEGYAAVGATSAPEALKALRGGAFDIVIADLHLPELDGIALLNAARNIDPDVIGIVMTGHATIDTAIDALRGGALDYILKPFNLTGIMPVLARALAVRRLRRENTALLERVSEHTAELEVANRELRCANRELEALTESVSQQLCAPLLRISDLAESLLNDQAGTLSSAQQERARGVLDEVQRLRHLADDLLRFARIGRQTLKKRTMNVRQLVLDLLGEFRNVDPQRRVAVQVGALPDCQADPVLLRELFALVLSNAFKFTHDTTHATIEVHGHKEARESVYVIHDNGAGFDMRHAPQLFTIFQRLQGERDCAGTGVGLAIAQRIVERHGGRIAGQGEVGKGACFTFALPS